MVDTRVRLGALDGLRGVAALAVLADHLLYTGPLANPSLGVPIRIAGYGAQGVQLFFVISGFVIFMSLRDATPRSFLVSRFARLYPAYLCAIAITLGVLLALPSTWRVPGATGLALNATMAQAYFGVAHLDPSYWTLGVELAFYLQVAGLWFTGILRRHLYRTLWIWLVFAVLIALLVPSGPQDVMVHPALWADKPLWARDLFLATGYLPWFITGIVAFQIWEKGISWNAVSIALGACVAQIVLDQSKSVGYLGLFYLIVVVTVVRWRSFGLGSRALVMLGEISYLVYLLHQVVGETLMGVLVPLTGQAFATAVAVLVVLVSSWLVTRFVDTPVRRFLRRKLGGARQSTVSRLRES